MNAIEAMRAAVLARCPEVEAEIDPPFDPAGPWHLDVQPPGGRLVVVEWRPGVGFGVSTPDADDLGASPDEFHPDADATLARVVALVESGGRAVPPAPVRLGELRRGRGLTQTALASAAGVTQAAVAQMEARGGAVMVASLAKVVAAMGGKLAVRAEFPDGSSHELDFHAAGS